MTSPRATAPRLRAVLAATAVVAGMLVVAAPSAGAVGPSTVSQTFSYTGATTTFTVPAGITALTLTALGAHGGLGGRDSAGFPPAGGYQGAVTGTIAVTPGQVLTIAVGKGGASGAAGHGSNVPANYLLGAAVGGSNPLGGYAGGNGGVAGPQGSSGYGAGGGAATVITTAGATIVAGGSGGSGGSGQYAPTLGRLPYATYTGRSDTTSTVGQLGITVATVCNSAPAPGCDGGGSGGGGGGAQGGAQGQVQFGSGTSNEWFGYGGYPGQNSTGGLSGLSATYQSFSTNGGGGSVTISDVTGPPADCGCRRVLVRHQQLRADGHVHGLRHGWRHRDRVGFHRDGDRARRRCLVHGHGDGEPLWLHDRFGGGRGVGPARRHGPSLLDSGGYL